MSGSLFQPCLRVRSSSHLTLSPFELTQTSKFSSIDSSRSRIFVGSPSSSSLAPSQSLYHFYQPLPRTNRFLAATSRNHRYPGHHPRTSPLSQILVLPSRSADPFPSLEGRRVDARRRRSRADFHRLPAAVIFAAAPRVVQWCRVVAGGEGSVEEKARREESFRKIAWWLEDSNDGGSVSPRGLLVLSSPSAADLARFCRPCRSQSSTSPTLSSPSSSCLARPHCARSSKLLLIFKIDTPRRRKHSSELSSF